MNNQQGSSKVELFPDNNTPFRRAPQRLHVKMYNFSMAPTIGIWCKLYIIYNPNLNLKINLYLTYEGHHTSFVQRGLTIGVALFIVSEVFAFVSVFWAFFHSSLAPVIEIGSQWPPVGIEAVNAFELPLLNTILLLSSGATVTYSHHALIQGNRRASLIGLILTIILALAFTA